MQRKKGSKRIEMIIKNGKRIQTHLRPFCTPKLHAHVRGFTTEKKNYGKSVLATGPPHSQAMGLSQAAGLLLANPKDGVVTI